MKKISFVVFVLAPILIFSQTYKKGYFIENSGQRTECYISNDVLLYSPELVEFRLEVSGPIQTKTINELKELALYDLIHYKKFTVDIDFSSSRIDELSNFKELTLQKKDLFLEILEKGKLVLYQYKLPSFTRFFFAKNENDIPELLDYKKYISGASESIVLTNEFYKQELLNAMFDGGITKSDIDRVGYFEKDLVKIFRKYNTIFNSVVELDNKGKDKAMKFLVAIKPKIAFSSMNMEYNFSAPTSISVYSPAKFSKIVPEIGLEFEGYLYKGFCVFIAANFFSFKTESNQILYGVAAPDVNFDASVNLQAAKFSFGLRKYFSFDNKENYSISALAGLSYMNVLNKEENLTIVAPAPIMNSNNIVPVLGLGMRFYKTFYAELIYEPNRNISPDYNLSRSELNVLSLSIAFDIINLFKKK